MPILERDPAVQAVTLVRHLQMTDPDGFPDDRVRRTLERRVRDWRALHGPARDVIFRQAPEPGRMALSDFTGAGALGVTSSERMRAGTTPTAAPSSMPSSTACATPPERRAPCTGPMSTSSNSRPRSPSRSTS